MNKDWRKRLIVLALVPMFSALLPPVGADELEDRVKQLDNVQNKVEKTQDRLAQKVREERDIWGELQKLTDEVTQTEKELHDTNRRLETVEDRVKEVEKELAQIEKKLQARLGALESRLQEIYMFGDVNLWEVVLQSVDISDFVSRFTLMQKLLEEDNLIIQDIEAQQKLMEMRKDELETKRNELAALKREQEARKSLLKTQSEEKQRLMDEVKGQESQLERMLNELEATSRRLETVIAKLQSSASGEPDTSGASAPAGSPGAPPASSGPATAGPMIHPAPGYGEITSPYGMRFHPILKKNKLHTGVDYGAPFGAKVVAAKAGTVLLAGSQGGYGNAVVVDHGGGISTLYAHLTDYVVKPGDRVARGQTIGHVGSTGWSTGAHLHFEVRQNGSPVNPMPYLGR